MNSLFSLSELGNREVEHGTGRDVGKSRVVKFEKLHSAKIENIKNLCGQFPLPGRSSFYGRVIALMLSLLFLT